MQPGTPEPKGKLDAMTGYSFTTPVWDGGIWVTPGVTAVRVAARAHGPEDQHRDAPSQWDPGLLQVARNLPRMPEYAKMLDAWKSATAARREQLGLSSEPAGAAAHYVVAPIASGDVVAAASEFGRWLHYRRDRTLTAIDMEAAGAAYAAYARIQGVPMLVVRGISDFADERKAEFDRTAGPHGKGAWRRYATMNAVDLLVRILTCEALMNATPDEPRSDVLPAVKDVPPATNLEKLERLVVARYPSTAALERLLANTGIDPRLLDMSGAVLVVAHRGIQTAQEHGK